MSYTSAEMVWCSRHKSPEAHSRQMSEYAPCVFVARSSTVRLRRVEFELAPSRLIPAGPNDHMIYTAKSSEAPQRHMSEDM